MTRILSRRPRESDRDYLIRINDQRRSTNLPPLTSLRGYGGGSGRGAPRGRGRGGGNPPRRQPLQQQQQQQQQLLPFEKTENVNGNQDTSVVTISLNNHVLWGIPANWEYAVVSLSARINSHILTKANPIGNLFGVVTHSATAPTDWLTRTNVRTAHWNGSAVMNFVLPPTVAGSAIHVASNLHLHLRGDVVGGPEATRALIDTACFAVAITMRVRVLSTQLQ